MEFSQGKELCDKCFDKLGYTGNREFTSMGTSEINKIVWYECGHVLIIKDGAVEQQFNYHK